MSTLKVATIQDTSGNNSSTPAGIASGTAKAWVNFNGTGTVAIREDFNVSSITDNATGQYTVTFTNAMADANFSFAVSGIKSGDNAVDGGGRQAPTSTTLKVAFLDLTNFTDVEFASVAIFR
tara:strand:- start:297 stop:662 length:366 start_codon:yes stop_codon:yes gene_type:complete